MKHAALFACVVSVCLNAAPAQAQERMVEVDGHQMHVMTIGLENDQSGSPVVVFEGGI